MSLYTGQIPRVYDNITNMKKFISRKVQKKLNKIITQKQVTVITGMRRVGKTTLLKHYYGKISSENKLQLNLEDALTRKIFAEIKVVYVERLPIRLAKLTIKDEKASYERIIQLAKSMLKLQSQIQETKSSTKKNIIRKQIEAVDAEIDRLVYTLYKLNSAEIATVEDGELNKS